MTKWSDGQMIRWPDGQKTGWPEVRMTRWPEVRMVRRPHGRRPYGQKSRWHIKQILKKWCCQCYTGYTPNVLPDFKFLFIYHHTTPSIFGHVARCFQQCIVVIDQVQVFQIRFYGTRNQLEKNRFLLPVGRFLLIFARLLSLLIGKFSNYLSKNMTNAGSTHIWLILGIGYHRIIFQAPDPSLVYIIDECKNMFFMIIFSLCFKTKCATLMNYRILFLQCCDCFSYFFMIY